MDRVHEAALKHDLAYRENDGLKQRNMADKEMLHDLYGIEQPTCRERLERCIVVPILLLKSLIGSLILKLISRA